MKGISIVGRELALVDKAQKFLANGPSSAIEVIAHVCSLPAPPAHIALRLADALLGGDQRFERDGAGRWRLTRSGAQVASEPSARPLARLRDLRYVVVDVETTGTRAAGSDRIVEIAAVVVERGEVTRAFESLVNPECPIPSEVSRLTMITGGMVRSAPRFAQVAAEIAPYLEGRVFVAHNAGFDWRFLSAELERTMGQRLDGDRLCTVRMTAALLPSLRRRSLDAVANYFGIEIGARHRAGGDARATAAVLLRLLRLAEERGAETIDDLKTLGRAGRRPRKRRRASPHWMTRDESA